MKITFQDLGALACGELELKPFTIIAGANNSGKTYVSYSLWGFLHLWGNFVSFSSLRDEILRSLLDRGEAEISSAKLVKHAKSALAVACEKYSRNIHRVLAGTEKHFDKTIFKVQNVDFVSFKSRSFEHTASRAKKSIIRVSYAGGEEPVKVSLLFGESSREEVVSLEMINLAFSFLDRVLKDHIFGSQFPEVYIASAERTGATIFQKELDLARNRLLDNLGNSSADKSQDLFQQVKKISKDYALPVKSDIDFIRGIEGISKETSELVDAFPDILDDFHDIIGGEYKMVKNEGTVFMPRKGGNTRLTMGESSSAVRSLLNIGAYLRHKAKPGDLLIIDEPELNLHPANQRKVARLLARLVNVGVKIFITTHSDYLIKELNTLIMLSGKAPHLRSVMEKEGYKVSELLTPEQMSVYLAKQGLCKYGEMKKAKTALTLVPAEVDHEQGIWVESFDKEIEEMDRIQSAILYGGGEGESNI
jgi:predicted ATPase